VLNSREAGVADNELVARIYIAMEVVRIAIEEMMQEGYQGDKKDLN
jgi:hypothetical protein